jgi:hypothetical protein
MMKTEGHAEFDRWWSAWLSRLALNRVVVEPRVSGKKPGADVKRTADAGPGDLALESDAAPAGQGMRRQ